ncbi:MAG: PAS domain S-box protein [Caldimonas sp.]
MNDALARPAPLRAHLSGASAKKGSIDPTNLRASLLTLILRVSAYLGFVVYVPSVILGVRQGLYGVVVIDTLAISVAIGLYHFDRLPFGWRAGSICAIYYTLAIGLLVGVGSISQIYLFGFSIVVVLLFGLRAGLAAALLSSLSLFVAGALGHAAPEMMLPGYPHGLTEWLVITINFALVDTLLTLAIGAVLVAVSTALSRAVETGASLDRERALLRTLIDTLPDVVFTKDAAGRFVNCNPATLALHGVEREDQVAGKTVFDFFPPEIATPYHADDLAVMAGQTVMNREERGLDGTGRVIWFLTIKVPLRDAAGEVIGLIGVSRDITSRKHAEAERVRLLAELQMQIERMPLAYFTTDRYLRFTRWNPAAERIFGYTEAEVLGTDLFEAIALRTTTSSTARVLERIRDGTFATHYEAEQRMKDGSTVTCVWHHALMFDEDGEFSSLLSLGEDVTAHKKLEAQLRQSQKMEAIGQLAGGVAHDFNNLLSVILSYSELLLEDLGPSAAMREEIQEIHNAGQRAADLTRQLLMFSRQQVIQPKVIDLNELMAAMDKMLRRLVGEDVELTSVAGAALGRVRADPGSIEQVVANLVVNARDAMPVGGKLTMETANVTIDEAFAATHLGANPGAYVMLSVTDTGSGMDKQTLARIFEPFFTTKERGKGTGLGLSTVFGIVQQCGGAVWVYSEPGFGSTFKVYLPRVDAGTAATLSLSSAAAPRGSETILLVEDEDPVRDVARGILERSGYRVIEARDGAEALLISERHPGTIDLLLTDVVMPKMSGPELARRLASSRPGTKVLCMSGYTDDAAFRHGLVDARFAHLQKPLTIGTLTRAVRAVLDAPVDVPPS